MTKPLLPEDEIDFAEDLDDRLRRIERSTAIEAWHYVGTVGEPAFQNAWVNFDALRVARYYRFGGRVFLEGIIKSGASGTIAFTLPAGYRPTIGGSSIIFPVISNGALGIATVSNTGDVNVQGSNVYIDLSPISFRCV